MTLLVPNFLFQRYNNPAKDEETRPETQIKKKIYIYIFHKNKKNEKTANMWKNAYIHNVVAFMKSMHIFTPAVLYNVVNK